MILFFHLVMTLMVNVSKAVWKDGFFLGVGGRLLEALKCA